MSEALDLMLEPLRSEFSALSSVVVVDSSIRVRTHCMYPSNGLIDVFVRGGRDTIVVSDEGGALGEALSAGIEVKSFDRQLLHIVRENGLRIENGVIHTSAIPISAAPTAILLVANTVKEVSHYVFDHSKLKKTLDFRVALGKFLKDTFDDRLHKDIIVGNSNKAHKFHNVIEFPNGRRLVIDPVINDPSSMNSRVVAHMDVRASKDSNLLQRIVYDEDEGWSPSDLNLLAVGAPIIAFSRSHDVIRRLAMNE